MNQAYHRCVSIHIPAGIERGMRICLNGLGDAGDYQAKSGDLYVEVRIR